ncbi:metallophosphoesterase family protein [Paenalkalicoccus suaedae]|uniref:Metallophosphoesterase family protein n=1 Tax=Paenalkalicoccus suaedae TaxID=2592382 RepID=A0A859FCS3_9BACI|nr:metallophosphoesterase family protein [Paenalkalicoccus suaedae]QKS71143.1 metallophosphoesterase family protein [Paenalkalicoccus suaedae]
MKKIAVISDIHGNMHALQAVLADIKSQYIDEIVVLGDLAFRGPHPNECVDLVKKHARYVIKGNADEWAVRGIHEGEVPEHVLDGMRTEQAFTHSQLTEENLTYLHSLPETLELPLTNKKQLFVFHATPDSLFEVVPSDASNEKLLKLIASNERANLFAYGHIHVAHQRTINGKLVFNTGSVGLPFDGDNRASYAIVHAKDDVQLTLRRVSYDIDAAVEALASYPAHAIPLLTHVYTNGALPK